MELEQGNAPQEATEIKPAEGTVEPQRPGMSVIEPEKSTGQTEPPKEDWDFTKDARWNKMWKSPNDVYKSYRELERMKAEKFDPVLKQYNETVKLLKEKGYSPEQITEIVNGYHDLSRPEHPTQQRSSYLSAWLDNPLYKDKVVGFFQDLERSELQRLYPGMNAEQIQKQMELEQRVSNFEKMQQEQQHRELVSNYQKQAVDSLKKITEFSEKRGFQFSDEIKQELLQHCSDNEIEPKYMFSVFLDKYGEQLDKLYNDHVEKSVMERLNKNKGQTIIGGGAGKPAQPENLSFKDKVSRALGI